MIAQPDLRRLNDLPQDQAEAALLACCASRRWVRTISAGRPYDDLVALRAASARALAELEWRDVLEALNAHPRIGDRVGGDDREAKWSRGEQSGMDAAADGTRQAMIDGNLAYEKRFDHVFLICATGRSAAEMLEQLRTRLDNDTDAERSVVRAELSKIIELRLTKLVTGVA